MFPIFMIFAAVGGIFLAVPAQYQHSLNNLCLILIGLVFFLQGARLPTGSLRSALKNWGVQARIAAFSFIIFPVIGITILLIVRSLGLLTNMSPNLELGFIVLCCIPSTVQSSVAMTAVARGDMPVAITSSALSSMLGLFLSPALLWIVIELGIFKVHADFGISAMLGILKGLLIELLIPFIVGRLLSQMIGPLLRSLSWLGFWDKLAIVVMVYSIFCEATHNGVWFSLSIPSLLIISLMEAILLASVLWLSWVVSGIGSLSYATRIAVQFCSSKKALSFAIPLIAVIVESEPALKAGLLLIPTMLYHQMQLFVASFLANHYGRRTTD